MTDNSINGSASNVQTVSNIQNKSNLTSSPTQKKSAKRKSAGRKSVATKKSSKKTSKNDTLTRKQLNFCNEYIVDFNATQAAIRAGYKGRAVAVTAHELLKKPNVVEYIKKRQAEIAKRSEISIDRVLNEYAKLAFVDPRSFFDEKGRLIPIHKLPEDAAAAITSIEITEKGKLKKQVLTKIKFADKKAALDSIAKHLGMFTEKIEYSINESVLANMFQFFKSEDIEKIRLAMIEMYKKEGGKTTNNAT